MNADKTTDFLNYRELAASAPETVTGQDLLPDKNVESAALAASLSAPPKSPAAGNSCGAALLYYRYKDFMLKRY